MKAKRYLKIKAGPEALKHLRQNGLQPAHIELMVGASGGPKWLVLSPLDRVLMGWLLKRHRPVFLAGASSGAWRMVCYGLSDPVGGLERLERSYVEQTYPPNPHPDLVVGRCADLLHEVLGPGGSREVLRHPTVRLSLMTTLTRGWAARPGRLQMLGLAAAGLASMVTRRLVGLLLTRVVFSDPRTRPPFWPLEDLPSEKAELTRDNLQPALLASGAIPLVIRGVPNIPGGHQGVYRDGGVLDYHLDLPNRGPGLTLFCHFTDHQIPVYFDRYWPYRGARNRSRMVALYPDPEFVSRLPRGKLPDRNDFYRLPDRERIKSWYEAVNESQRLAEELAEFLDSPDPASLVEPLALKGQNL